jgi:carboxylesterase
MKAIVGHATVTHLSRTLYLMAKEGAPAGWMQDWSAQGSGKNARVGVLLVHGFTGAPPSMRPWGEFFHSKGYTVRVPLLPGHGTVPTDLNKVKWQQWPEKVQFELDELLKTCDQVFICGLSMGGGTTLHIAQNNLDTISGLILVNPMIHVAFMPHPIASLVAKFQKIRPAVSGDIKRPGISEYGYDALPMRGVAELLKMLKVTRKNLGKVTIPVQLFHSVEDHTLPVSNTEIIMAGIASSNKSRIELVNSYHVATLDYDQELIFQNSLTFIEGLTSK